MIMPELSSGWSRIAPHQVVLRKKRRKRRFLRDGVQGIIPCPPEAFFQLRPIFLS
jgi:hypothetical protein